MSSKGERLQDEGSRLQVAVAGGMAGLISRFIVAPLDVVKIRLQLQTHSLSDPLLAQRDLRGSPVYKGTLRTMRHIVTHEGLTGLWKGNVPAEAMYVCYSAVQFSAYRAATLLLQEGGQALGLGLAPRPGLEAFAAGAAAGACATAATYPLDLLRTRFAAQGSGHDRVYTNLRQALRTIARDEGLRGFFRGLGPALVQIAPFMGIFFAVYEGLRRPFRALAGGAGAGGEGKPNTPGSSAHRGLDLFRAAGGPDAAAGMIAAVASKTAVFPLDLLRKRIQVQGPTRQHYVHKNIPAYDGGMAATLRTILRHEGVRGLYRGLTVSLIKAAPASTITMWTYERLLNAMMEWQQERDGGRTAV